MKIAGNGFSDFPERRMISEFAVVKLFLTMCSQGRQKWSCLKKNRIVLLGWKKKSEDEMEKFSRTVFMISQ